MAATMNSWQLVEFGRSNLHLEQVSVPVAGPGEVLIKVHAASLNYRDMPMIEDGMGMSLDGPFTPASDMAGTVAVRGRGVVQFKPGDRVISAFFNNWVDGVAPQPIISLGGPGPGTLSEYVVLNENALVRAPASLTPAQASTLTCAGLTAWFALAEAGSTRVGDVVVVQGTGGVALFAVQLAHAQRSEEHTSELQSLMRISYAVFCLKKKKK